MASKFRQGKDSVVRQWELAINGATSNPAIGQLLAERGYGSEELAEGSQLLGLVRADITAQAVDHAAYHSIVDQVETQRQQLVEDFSQLAKIGKVAFKKDPERLAALGLKGAVPQKTAAFITKASTFFATALQSEQDLATFARYGFSHDWIESLHNRFNDFDQASRRVTLQKGEAQVATTAQDEALAAMHEWYSSFIVVARVALSGRPQLLEELGIVVKPRQPRTKKAEQKE